MTRSDSFDETLAGIRAAKAAGSTRSPTPRSRRSTPTGSRPSWTWWPQEGLPTFAVNGMIYSGKGKASGTELTPQEVIPVLERLAQGPREKGVRLVWYTPTRYCELNPVEMALGVKQCTAARISMAVEPDGTVIPCQSYYEGVGNMLTDPWESDLEPPPLPEAAPAPEAPRRVRGLRAPHVMWRRMPPRNRARAAVLPRSGQRRMTAQVKPPRARGVGNG